MSALPALTTIAGLCCLLLQLQPASSASLTANLKHVQLPINDTIIIVNAENGTFVYTSCRKLTGSQGPTFTCGLTLDNLDTSKSCDINPVDMEPSRGMYPRYLTADKAILAWETKVSESEPDGALVLTVVHFDDDCKSYDIRIPNENEKTMTLISVPDYVPILNRGDGSFDIVYNNVDKCGDKACKAGFDYQGKKVRNEVPWIPASVEKAFQYRCKPGVHQLLPNSPEDGYLVRDAAYTYIALSIKDDGNGTQKFLRNFSTEAEINEDMDVIFSVAHKLLTICHYDDNISTRCEQLDFHNTSIAQPIDIVFSHEYYPGGSSVHSLSGGGFLLASVGGCPGNEPYCSVFVRKFVVTRYGRDGKTSGKIEIGGVECDRTVFNQLKLYEKEEGRYCLSQRCTCTDEMENKNRNKINFSVTCFSDNDFS